MYKHGAKHGPGGGGGGAYVPRVRPPGADFGGVGRNTPPGSPGGNLSERSGSPGRSRLASTSAEYRAERADAAIHPLGGVEQPRLPARDGSQLWGKLRDHVEENEQLKSDLRMHRSLFGQHIAAIDSGLTAGGLDSNNTRDLISALKQRRYIILPGSTGRLYWDLLQVAILTYLAWALPIRVGFSIQSRGVWFVLDLIVDLYFAVDIAVNFLSAYVDKGTYQLVTNPRLIAIYYFKTWFFLDVVALLPVDYAMRIVDGTFVCSLEGSSPCNLDGNMAGSYLKVVRMLRLIKLMKLVRLLKFSRLFERYQDDLFEVLHLIALGRIILTMIYTAHVLGCMWHFFGDETWLTAEEKSSGLRSWLVAGYGEEYTGVGLGLRYMACLYWAFTTMTTVGYGDITADTVAERVWASCAMLCGTFFFSWVCGSIVQELEVSCMQQMAFNQKMVSVHSFVRDMQLDRETRVKVLSYFRTQDIKGYDEKGLLFELPFELRTHILKQLYRELIESVPLFHTRDSVLITELCSRVIPCTLTKGGFVYRTGETAKDMHIVAQGDVEVTDSRGKRTIAIFGKGSYFGEGCLFGEVRRHESIRCRSSVSLLSILRADMGEVLRIFPGVAMQMRTVFIARRKEYSRKLDQAKTEEEVVKTGRKSMLFQTEGEEALESEIHEVAEVPEIRPPSSSNSFNNSSFGKPPEDEAPPAPSESDPSFRGPLPPLQPDQEAAMSGKVEQLEKTAGDAMAVAGAMDGRMAALEARVEELHVLQATHFEALCNLILSTRARPAAPGGAQTHEDISEAEAGVSFMQLSKFVAGSKDPVSVENYFVSPRPSGDGSLLRDAAESSAGAQLRQNSLKPLELRSNSRRAAEPTTVSTSDLPHTGFADAAALSGEVS